MTNLNNTSLCVSEIFKKGKYHQITSFVEDCFPCPNNEFGANLVKSNISFIIACSQSSTKIEDVKKSTKEIIKLADFLVNNFGCDKQKAEKFKKVATVNLQSKIINYTFRK